MWTGVISIDKQYRNEINYLLARLSSCKLLSFAGDESDDRMFFHVACLCDNADKVRDFVADLLCELYLKRMKLDYFLKKINISKLDYPTVTLLASLTFFDRTYEESVVKLALTAVSDYSVDGIYNFRLSKLKDNWNELVELSNGLLSVAESDKDIYNVCTFVSAGELCNNLRLSFDRELTVENLSTGKRVVTEEYFGDCNFDFLFAVLGEKPREIEIATDLPDAFLNCIKHLETIKFVELN